MNNQEIANLRGIDMHYNSFKNPRKNCKNARSEPLKVSNLQVSRIKRFPIIIFHLGSTCQSDLRGILIWQRSSWS